MFHHINKVLFCKISLFGVICLIVSNSIIDFLDTISVAIINYMCVNCNFFTKQHKIFFMMKNIFLNFSYRYRAKTSTNVLNDMINNQ